jgi:FHA domain
MLKCPFCHFDNEDGALFCEQCKSDLGSVQPAAAPPPLPEPVPMAAVIEEPIPMAPVVALPEPPPVPVAIPDVPAPPPIPEFMPPPVPTMEQAPPPPPAEAPAPPPPPAAVAPPPPTPAPPPAAPVAAAPAPAAAGRLAADAKPRLVVLRGQKINQEFPLYEGQNFIGRADEKPVDIDLEDQEPPEKVWTSRQHAVITFDDGQLKIEDLNSANGTYVNRARIYPGQPRPLNVNDVIQIGTVHLKVRA